MEYFYAEDQITSCSTCQVFLFQILWSICIHVNSGVKIHFLIEKLGKKSSMALTAQISLISNGLGARQVFNLFFSNWLMKIKSWKNPLKCCVFRFFNLWKSYQPISLKVHTSSRIFLQFRWYELAVGKHKICTNSQTYSIGEKINFKFNIKWFRFLELRLQILEGKKILQ